MAIYLDTPRAWSQFLVVTVSCFALVACGGGGSSNSPDQSVYTLNISVSNLTATGLVLTDGTEIVPVAAGATNLTFQNKLNSGASYSVTIAKQPAGFTDICTLSNGSGTAGSSNISAISVRCQPAQAAVSTFAGGAPDHTSNGAGSAAGFRAPTKITVDVAGNVYVADTHSIRKITSQGLVTTLAGGLIAGNADGVGTAASFDYIFGLATDVSGNVYVADYFNNKIRKVSPAGVVTTFAGSGVQGKSDGPAAVASFFGPTSIAIDSHGTIYVSDSQNGLIRKITSEGVVSSLAGSGHFGNVDGTGTSASFGSTLSIAIDKSDYLYVSDEDNNSIRKITPTGVVTTFSALIGFDHSGGLTLDMDGNLFVADIMNQQIKKVTPAGLISTLAGRGPGLNTDVDGIGIAANFYRPVDISRDTSGTLYVVDAGANLIRKITAQ